MYYFIYKPVSLASIGGISLPYSDEMNLDLGRYGDWCLGSAEDYNKLILIREFNPRIVPESVWRGLPLLGVEDIAISWDDPAVSRPFNEQELADRKDAYNWELKEKLRFLIEIGVGDGLDQQANTDKQLHLMTGMIVRMYRMERLIIQKLVANGTLTQAEYDEIMPDAIKTSYSAYADTFAAMVDNGTYKDRTDLEDPTIMIPKLMEATITIQALVKSEYLDKLV